MKRVVSLAAVALVLATILWRLCSPLPVPRPALETQVTPAPIAFRASAPKEEPLDSLNLAEDLNAPNKTIQNDLRVLNGVFLVWQTNFLRTGNPVGDNAEITAALLGRNNLRLSFISSTNRAINSQGQLCDRWGTPFFFHQISGTQMEIVSAGPDRTRGTPDDVALSP